jgi:RHS repeat-associated protein
VADPNSKVTTYTYDSKDHVSTVTDPASGVTTLGYDAVGNLTSKQNPRIKTTTYTYDNLSRLASEIDPLSHVRTYGYDAASRLTSRQDAKSQTTTYTYNDRNELTNLTYPDSSYVSFAYDDAGARTQMVDSTGTTAYSYDSLYRLTSVTFPGSRTVSYGYDDASRRTSVTYPGGSNQATYAYDVANRLTSVTDWNSRAVAYAYDDAGRMTTATLPATTGIVSSYSYDNANRLTGISHVQNGSTTIAPAAYTLDAVGNRTQRVDQAGTYAYDNLYRLTSVTYPGPSTTSYAFDAFGNRTSLTDGSGATNYAYDNADRITSVTPPSPAPVVNYTWDNNGDLTNRGSDSFAWDYEDRMTSATVNSTTTTFAYRGDGLRNSRTTGGVTTTFTWDIAGGLPVVLDDGNQYVYGAGLASMVTGTGTYYYLPDGLGSTMAVVDTSGAVQKSYTYDVYGKPTATGALANEFDFAGQQTDPTGLQYLRARYMDPATGTFTSRDPMGASPGWDANAFGYADGAPTNLADPGGLSSAPPNFCNPPYLSDDTWVNGRCPHTGIPPGCGTPWTHACSNSPKGAYAATIVGVVRLLPLGIGEYAHNRLRNCARDSECRVWLNGLLDTRAANGQLDILNEQLKASPWPQLTVLVTVAKVLPFTAGQIWWAYKERYDN